MYDWALILLQQLTVFVDGKFEALELFSLSTPPDLPEVMKQAAQEGGSQQAGEQPSMT